MLFSFSAPLYILNLYSFIFLFILSHLSPMINILMSTKCLWPFLISIFLFCFLATLFIYIKALQGGIFIYSVYLYQSYTGRYIYIQCIFIWAFGCVCVYALHIYMSLILLIFPHRILYSYSCALNIILYRYLINIEIFNRASEI